MRQWARRRLRRLLELDQPVPEQSEVERADLVERNFRWNAFVNLMDGSLFWLALSLISASTIVPLFISKLTTSTLPIGIAAMVAQAGWSLPQILTANWAERLPRRKPLVIHLTIVAERLPFWVLVIAASLAGKWPAVSLVLFLVAYSWRVFGGGMVGTPWMDMIARVIPLQRRGRFWGLSSSLGVGFGVAGSLLSAWLLRTLPFPKSFVILFAMAAALVTTSWFFLAQTREPAERVTAPRQSQGQFLASLPPLVRQDAPFRRFLVARTLLALAAMGSGFVTVSALRRWSVSDATVGIYTAAQLVGMTAGNLLFGWLGDRYGHKRSLEWGALAYGCAFGVAWLAPVPAWYYAAFVFLGIAGGAMTVSGMMVILEFSAPERRPTYIGIGNTAVGVASLIGPLAATGLASIEVQWVFVPSVAFAILAWAAMRWWVAEPRRRHGDAVTG
ncbi:MAG TPA: MFS transporter [Anaerolineae bacterium]|nr:MFS transporter [Anaerolineae bacterium]